VRDFQAGLGFKPADGARHQAQAGYAGAFLNAGKWSVMLCNSFFVGCFNIPRSKCLLFVRFYIEKYSAVQWVGLNYINLQWQK
jgi:hypothetical protein